MTPTSMLAGMLTGLLEGLGIAVVVFVVLQVMARRERAVPVQHPVAEDEPAVGRTAYVPKDT